MRVKREIDHAVAERAANPVMVDLAYARPVPVNRIARWRARLRLPLRIVLLLVPVMTAAAALLVTLGLPHIREQALLMTRIGASGNVSDHVGGEYTSYNLNIAWTDLYGEDGFRAVLYPNWIVRHPVRVLADRDRSVHNPNDAWWQDGAMRYGPSHLNNIDKYERPKDGDVSRLLADERAAIARYRIDYPPGTDTAVFAPDGSVRFIDLAPKYVHFGEEQTELVGEYHFRAAILLRFREMPAAVAWPVMKLARLADGLVAFPARKRFLDTSVNDGLNVEAMKADGLLPKWAETE